jgi:NDP-sugar pyrophosphorylase family protein
MLAALDTVVLAGGLGTRLREALPEGDPKALAKVGARTAIDLVIDWLYAQGVRRIVLALGYGAQRVVEALQRRASPRDLSLHHSVESAPLGTGGALRLALPQLRSDPVLALNGDSLSDVDLARLVRFHQEKKAAVTVALARVADAARYGSVTCAADGAVTRFAEKAPGAGLVNCGVYVISRAVLDALPAGPLSWERDVLERRVGNGLYAMEAATRFIDIGTPQSLGEAAAFVQEAPR